MKKYKAGLLYLGQGHVHNYTYYTEDFVTFYRHDGSVLNEDDLEDWAVELNSPWSQADQRYVIKVNCKDGYTEIEENEPIWVCEYSIIGYDRTEASVCGYGNTEIEALDHCKSIFQLLQEKYNAEGESFDLEEKIMTSNKSS